MCLYLIGSQYKNLAEVELLLKGNSFFSMTEEEIMAIKDDREKIEEAIWNCQNGQDLEDLGI